MTGGGRRPASGMRRFASRTIFGPDGTRWLVQEVEDPYSRRSNRSLVFSSDTVMRRVRSYPAHWLELSETELYALSFAR